MCQPTDSCIVPHPEQCLPILEEFEDVEAVGLSGSVARSVSDEFSDLDICVFVKDQLPSPDKRKRKYEEFGISDFRYFDGDLKDSRIDGLVIDDVDFDFLWMSLRRSERFLRDLSKNHECDEYLPGGLLELQPLVDPRQRIASLRGLIPPYSEARAKARVKSNVKSARFSIYALEWTTKAPYRNDYFSFFFNKWMVFDHFVSALFALNRQWRAHEKRIIDQIRRLDIVPRNAACRVESIILHDKENTSLEANAGSIKELLSDLTALALKQFPDIDLPVEWK